MPSQGPQHNPTWASAALEGQSVIQEVKTHAGDCSPHVPVGGSLRDGLETVPQATGCVRHRQRQGVLGG